MDERTGGRTDGRTGALAFWNSKMYHTRILNGSAMLGDARARSAMLGDGRRRQVSLRIEDRAGILEFVKVSRSHSGGLRSTKCQV